MRVDIRGDGRAGADGGAVADAQRRHQLTVGADERARADKRAVLVRAVVVAGDDAGADVGGVADVGVAEVGEVVGFGGAAEARIFDFHEVADARLGVELRAGTQAGERPDSASRADVGALDNAVRFDNATVADATVADDAAGPDDASVADFDFAFQHHIDIDHAVAAERAPSAQVESRRVDDAHTVVEQRARLAGLKHALGARQVGRGVDAQGLLRGRRASGDVDAGGGRMRDDVGQVKFVLRVVVAEAGQARVDDRGRRGDEAGVAFAEVFLRGGGVLFLDDARHPPALVAHDAPQPGRAGRIVGAQCEQAEFVAGGRGQQVPQRRGLNQRRVAVYHQHRGRVGHPGHRQLRRVAGAARLVLGYPGDVGARVGGFRFPAAFDGIAHFVAALGADHDVNFARRQRAHRVENVR